MSCIIEDYASRGSAVSGIYEIFNGYKYRDIEAMIQRDPMEARQHINFLYLDMDMVRKDAYQI